MIKGRRKDGCDGVGKGGSGGGSAGGMTKCCKCNDGNDVCYAFFVSSGEQGKSYR